MRAIEAPSVVHGSSDKAQGEFMREQMNAAGRKFGGVQNGKGSRWRTLPNQTYKANYDSIFRKDKTNNVQN